MRQAPPDRPAKGCAFLVLVRALTLTGLQDEGGWRCVCWFSVQKRSVPIAGDLGSRTALSDLIPKSQCLFQKKSQFGGECPGKCLWKKWPSFPHLSRKVRMVYSYPAVTAQGRREAQRGTGPGRSGLAGIRSPS